jgi:hypothetical protein
MLFDEFKIVQLSGLPSEPGRINDKWNNVIQGGKYPYFSEVVENSLTITLGSSSF